MTLVSVRLVYPYYQARIVHIVLPLSYRHECCTTINEVLANHCVFIIRLSASIGPAVSYYHLFIIVSLVPPLF